MSNGSDELIDSFVVESNESLADMENDFLSIEAAGADIDDDLVNRVFRGIHSMKGSAGFLGLKSIGSLAHEMENVLNLIRGHELVPTSAIVDAMLRGADALRGMVNDVSSSNDVDVSEYVATLKAAVTGAASPETQEALNREVDVQIPGGSLAFMMVPLMALISRQRQGCHIYVVEVDFIDDVQVKGMTPLEFLKRVYEQGELIDSYVSSVGIGSLSDELPESVKFMMLVGSKHAAAELAGGLDLPAGQVHHIASPEQSEWGERGPVAAGADVGAVEPAAQSVPQAAEPAAPTAAEPSAPVAEAPAAPPAARKPTAPPDASLRVRVSVLDQLMSLAGELVLGRNQLVQVVSSGEQRAIDSVAARIDQVTSELQDAIMQTRMQPVGSVFNKFGRIVRDLSAKLNKQCDLAIEGKDVELDKAIIEGIADPLTHLVRNSIDHGVESPEVRTASGKPAVGKITLRAFHEAGKVNIEIADDGAGIDAAKLREKAVSKGIMGADEARELGERDAVRLIFHAGFSMAEKVSDVSGRGVGMDVVRTNIEKLGGTVEVDTALGKGTTIRIRLPLTLAIIPSLVVRCGGERFAIPQVSISELVRIKAGNVARKIERVKDAEVLRLRGALLPLVRLSTALDSPSKYVGCASPELSDNQRQTIADRRDGTEPDASPESEVRSGDDRRLDTVAGALNIIVVESGHLRYGLIVDALRDSEEIVVKPLGRHMKDCGCLAGATILGDGKVALILDVAGIAAHLQLAAVGDDRADDAVDESKVEMQSVLLFTNDPSECFAVPMPLISRIERIRVEQIDSVGGQEVLQYRGTSLPLLSLEHHISAKPRPEKPQVYVVVFSVSGREVGLIAPELEDIRTIPAEVDTATFSEPGLFGSTIVDDKATRLIDIYSLAERAHPEWFVQRESNSPAQKDADTGPSRILLAEDSSFFRKQLVSVLEDAGHEVVGCEDGQLAWETLQDPEQSFDLVVTDIEMPNLDGLGLARNIKGDQRYAHLPIIAVTSLASEEDIQRGIEAGVDEYQVKLDREKVLAAAARCLASAKARA